MKQYEHFISLGYFCSVALELDRIGLRSSSYPFDWCISNFEGVIETIRNQFEGFLDYEHLLQSDATYNHYFNETYRIWFFHDFDKYHPLKKQLPKVRKKYMRRIERFYNDIKHPTLFVRYISDEIINESTNKSIELEYIEKNHIEILSLLKSFNRENEIIYIANRGVSSSIINIFNVDKDDNDGVARKPLEKNQSLNDFLMSFEYNDRQNNIAVYNKKLKRKGNRFFQIYRERRDNLKKRIFPEYIHNRVVLHSTK